MTNNVPYINHFQYNYYQNLSYYQNYDNFNQNNRYYSNYYQNQINGYDRTTFRYNNVSNRNNGIKKDKNIRNFKQSRVIDCKICNLFFKTNKLLEEHINDIHIKCNFEDCNFSGPLEILEIHKLKHIKNENGESVIDSKEETIKWINSRIQNFPKSSNQSQNLIGLNTDESKINGQEYHNKDNDNSQNKDKDELNKKEKNRGTEKKDDKCLLEIYLRNNMNNKKDVQNNSKSIVYPMLNKVQKQPSALIRYTNPYKYEHLLKKMDSLDTPYSFKSSINEKVIKSKDFKNGKNFNKKSIDYSIPKRPPAILELIRNDINHIDNLVVDCIKAIVQNKFFDN